MSFPSQVFKAYDIRGLVDGELSDELAYRLGRAFVEYLRTQKIDLTGKSLVVGRDMRPTSPGFEAEVIRGIQDEGVSVVTIGQVSTPLFNFACANYPDYAGGIMVTASHNPAEYNGFKMTLGNGLPVPGKPLLPFAENVSVEKVAAERGTVNSFNPLPDYLKKVFSLVPVSGLKPFKIVIDCGNGMAAATFPELVKSLPGSIEFMFLEPDGTFPNHEANPLKTETLQALEKRVLETKADFGFALDGDADRIGLVDETGHVVDASYVGAMLGQEVLRAHPKARMLFDVRSSQIVPEVWQAGGATAAMCMVGHANIKKQMKEEKAVFGSELSLHLYYGDVYDLESSDLSLLYIIQALSHSNTPLSKFIAPLKKYFHSGEINFNIADKAGAVERVEKKYASSALEISRLDGLWFKCAWGWFSIRLSNTESVVRLNVETYRAEDLAPKVKEISAVLIG